MLTLSKTCEPSDMNAGQPAFDPRQAGRSVPRLLLAEDDFEMRRFLSAALRRDGYEVVEAASGAQLLDSIGPSLAYSSGFDVDLIISDIRMPGLSGLEVLAGLRTYAGAPPIILITAFGDRETHERAEQLGAVAVFDKPFDVDDFRAFIRTVVRPAADPCTPAAAARPQEQHG